MFNVSILSHFHVCYDPEVRFPVPFLKRRTDKICSFVETKRVIVRVMIACVGCSRSQTSERPLFFAEPLQLFPAYQVFLLLCDS